MNTRRIGTALLGVVFLGFVIAPGALAAQGTPLPGSKIPQFVDPLPVLSAAGGTMETAVATGGEITLNMLEFQAKMLPLTFKPANGLPYAGTWVFGYRLGPTTAPATAVDTYIGPVIVATRGVPTQIRYVNNLTANNIAWRDWIDQSLHSAFHQAVGQPMPMPGDTTQYMGPVLAVPHLHGGEVPAILDGGPEAWFASNVPGPDTVTPYILHGPAYYAGTDVAGGGANPPAANEAIYRYPNTQEAAPLWFHDHLLGGTRINATFAGLAGGYALIDPGLSLPAGLDPVGLGGRLTVPLVIQDRMFDTNGQLYFPNVGINPEHPYWVPEFVGDTIAVNGKVWPYLNVDRQRYRFLLIDGSNSRPYNMFLMDRTTGVKGPRMWVIATDGGYLDKPVLVDPNATGAQKRAGVQKSLMMMPGERYEIIVDFADPVWITALNAAYAALGQAVPNPVRLTLRNTAATVMGLPNARTEGRIMEFRVSMNAPADSSYNPASGIPIRSGAQNIVRLADPVAGTLAAGVTANVTRQLTLNEVGGLGGPLEALVNNSKWNGLRPDGSPIPGSTYVLGNYLTEMPREGDTEVWEIVNTTVDSHPIHLHGLQFQLISRQPYDTVLFMTDYGLAFPGGGYIPGYGPPYGYDPVSNPLSGGKYGGNPDITPYLLGLPTPPLTFEAGWKDTVITRPGEVTRFAARVAPQDKAIGAADLFWTYLPDALNGAYVWHCHITDHEDNEMMRPSQFVPNPAAVRTYIQGVDY